MSSKSVVFAAAALLCACASAPDPAPVSRPSAAPQLRSLDERAAVALIERLLREAKLEPVQGWYVPLPTRGQLDVDVRLGDTGFGIEWVSAEDRLRYGDVLPTPDPSGQLRLLSSPAGGSTPQALILVLDHETYRVPVEGEERHAELHAGMLSEQQAREVEQRLRRDLTDFLEYARSQYRL